MSSVKFENGGVGDQSFASTQTERERAGQSGGLGAWSEVQKFKSLHWHVLILRPLSNGLRTDCEELG